MLQQSSHLDFESWSKTATFQKKLEFYYKMLILKKVGVREERVGYKTPD